MYEPTDSEINAAAACRVAEARYLRAIGYYNDAIAGKRKSQPRFRVVQFHTQAEDAQGALLATQKLLYVVCDFRPERVEAARRVAWSAKFDPHTHNATGATEKP